MEIKKHYSTVLTIAGSDSIGGAGIQADIKTCTALGVYSMSVITAITAQNTCGVISFIPTPPDLLRQQLDAVLTDVMPDAVKIGMLPDVSSVEIVADALKKYNLKNIVLDPVMIATSGDLLTDNTSSSAEAMKSLLFPIADIITPNLPESQFITGTKINSEDDIKNIAEMITNNYSCRSVFIKGGHRKNGYAEDILLDNDRFTVFKSELIDTVNTHGTGCSLSSAIACYLAKGDDLIDAVGYAKKFIYNAIKEGCVYELGKGHGPINHLWQIIQK